MQDISGSFCSSLGGNPYAPHQYAWQDWQARERSLQSQGWANQQQAQLQMAAQQNMGSMHGYGPLLCSQSPPDAWSSALQDAYRAQTLATIAHLPMSAPPTTRTLDAVPVMVKAIEPEPANGELLWIREREPSRWRFDAPELGELVIPLVCVATIAAGAWVFFT